MPGNFPEESIKKQLNSQQRKELFLLQGKGTSNEAQSVSYSMDSRAPLPEEKVIRA